jgi:hypothetical protein
MITLQKIKKINHKFHFLTNPILKKSEIKKIEKLKDQKQKQKNISSLMGKFV